MFKKRLLFLITPFILSLLFLAGFAQASKTHEGAPATDAVTGPLMCKQAFLPHVAFRPYATPCQFTDNDCEDNDQYQHAYGPLEADQPYIAFMEDINDFYYFITDIQGDITISVTNFPATDGYLQVFDANLAPLGADGYLPNEPMEVHLPNMPPGWYLIWLYGTEGLNPIDPYTLEVFYPPLPHTSQPAPPPDYNIVEEFTPLYIDEQYQAIYNTTWWTTIQDTHVFTYTIITGTQALPAKSGPHLFQVDYAKTDTYQFLGAELSPTARDLSWAETIDVWVKGDVSLLLKVEEDGSGIESDVDIITATNTLEWSLFRYDLRQLTTVDPAKIKSLKFFPAPGNDSASGTFYLDGIVARANVYTLEPFEPGINTADWWSPDPQSFLYTRTTGGCDGGYALKVNVNKTNEHQYISAELPPGLRDLSQAQTLEFLVYGAVDIEVKLEEDNGPNPGQEVTLGRLVSATPRGWSRLRYDYSHVQGIIDLTKVRNILFFPYPGNASASGTFSLDDIQITNEP